MKTCEITVGVSNRHLHLSEKDIEALFGPGYVLQRKKDLSQPGQYACEETVTLIGPKGKLDGVRILGPARSETQVELALTDAIKLGVKTEVRESGNIDGTAGIVIQNGDRSIAIDKGVIIAARHIHASDEDAKKYGLKDKDVVKALFNGPRGGCFDKVTVRVSPNYAWDFHIDTDEANAFGISNGDPVTIIIEE